MGFLIQKLSIITLPILVAIIFHEVAHGFVANRLGDPTAREMGRLSLNPLVHVDIFGTVLLPLLLILSNSSIIFGYAKPVPVNFFNLRDPKRDMVWVAAAGPVTNLALAFLSSLLLRLLVYLDPSLLYLQGMPYTLFSKHDILSSFTIPIFLMLIFSVQINILLAIFNLIPIPPLDGGRILVGVLPYRYSNILGNIEPFGWLILILIIFINPLGITDLLIFKMVNLLVNLLLGG